MLGKGKDVGERECSVWEIEGKRMRRKEEVKEGMEGFWRELGKEGEEEGLHAWAVGLHDVADVGVFDLGL